MTNEEILHIARLARLRIDPEELPEYAAKLESVLEYVQKLQQLDTEGVPELPHGAGLSNVFRGDVVVPCDEDVRARIVAAFPHREGDLLKVPAVFEDRTE